MPDTTGCTAAEAQGVLNAWAVLRGHPALTWVPPLWRSPDGSAPSPSLAVHAVRAVERNLLVHVAPEVGHGVVVRLGTGPLVDRELVDGVDPVTPVAVHDERLDVEGVTFEAALLALANRVVEVLGPVGDPRQEGQHLHVTAWYGTVEDDGSGRSGCADRR